MKRYRIKEIDGKFYLQERFCFFFWDDIKLHDRASRDWFITTFHDNNYLVVKDAWDVTLWFEPEFDTLEKAKSFIEEYKQFIKRNIQKQKVKYYY